MDCCNYMQYRHHQPYYGSPYYHEPLPPYHGDFYGQPVYHDYYSNGPYYAPQHWHAAGGFMQSDYVYNPKEARMRKAMREATRDRSIGASPMLPRPSARRAASIHPAWPPTLEEPPHLLMSSLGPPANMHRPHCYTPQPGADQFLPISSYAKLQRQQQASPQLPPAPPPSAPPTASYLQPSPLAQLQHQTEMWHNFQDDMRPASSTGNPYMMPDVQQPYHHHQPSPPLSIPSPLMMDKHRQTPLALHPLITPPLSAAATSMPMTPPHSINSNMSMTPPHSNENVSPDESFLPQRTGLQVKPSVEQPLDEMQPLGENNFHQLPQQHAEEYLPVYSVPNSQPQLENRMEDVKNKRQVLAQQHLQRAAATAFKKSPPKKPLPDFNEAFGTTERGRFQSPPDPRLSNNGLLDLFYEDTSPTQIKFADFQL